MGKGGVALGAGPERVDYAPRASWADDWGVLKAMWFAQHDSTGKGGAHQTRLENFYKAQAELYDGYRHRMLHGRKPMIENMPAPSGGTWLDLGGGTGSNLEYFGPNLDHFAAACPAGVRAVADLVLLDRFQFLLRNVTHPPPHK